MLGRLLGLRSSLNRIRIPKLRQRARGHLLPPRPLWAVGSQQWGANIPGSSCREFALLLTGKYLSGIVIIRPDTIRVPLSW